MRTFRIEMLTPNRITTEENVVSLIVPAYEGKLGIQAGHAPLVSLLKPGVIKLRKKGEIFKSIKNNAEAVLRVENNRVAIIFTK